MSEDEWLTCTDPVPMLAALEGKASDRSLRLFAVAGCRRVWPDFVDARCQRAAEVVERFVDGLATDAELAAARDEADRAQFEVWSEYRRGKQRTYWLDTLWAYWATFQPFNLGYFATNQLVHGSVEQSVQVALLRDVVGGLARPSRCHRLSCAGRKGSWSSWLRPPMTSGVCLAVTSTALASPCWLTPWKRPAAISPRLSPTCVRRRCTFAAAGRWTPCS